MGLSLRPVSVTLAAGNNNNFAGIGNSSFARITPDAGGTSVITGIVAPSAINDGQVIVIINIGAASMSLADQSASSTAANRLMLAGATAVTLATNQSISIIYDNTTARWRQYTPLEG